jgi:hypothetical protein
VQVSKPIIFFHIACIGKYQSIVNEVMGAIIASGLYESAERICFTVAGQERSGEHPLNLWWSMLGLTTDFRITNCTLEDGEAFTIGKLREAAINQPDRPYLYLHTKGVANGADNPCVDEWRRYMTHFCVGQWRKCIDALNSPTMCVAGCDWRIDPVPHFSGNFWWARGDYIAGLKPISETPVVISDRHRAEFWIGTGMPGYAALHDCGISQYERHLHRYPAERYM